MGGRSLSTVIVVSLAAMVFVMLILHVGMGGSSQFQAGEVLRAILGGPIERGDTTSHVIWKLRLPRACTALLVGGILGGVGAVFQSLFRNPLAEPFIIGVSSGAALGGSIMLVTGLSAMFWGLGMVAGAFVCGMLTLFLVMALARSRGSVEIHTLLISGVVVSAMLSSALSLVLLMKGHNQTAVLRWLLGSLSTTNWESNAILAGALLIGIPILYGKTRAMNAFALGESTAHRLGVDVAPTKMTVLAIGTAMTAAAVGAVGIIPFLGLVAPHIARRLVGVDLRKSFVAAVLIGMVLLLAADFLSAKTMDKPVGAITAVLGAPILLVLLRRAPVPAS